jgi:hypothetical protein
MRPVPSRTTYGNNSELRFKGNHIAREGLFSLGESLYPRSTHAQTRMAREVVRAANRNTMAVLEVTGNEHGGRFCLVHIAGLAWHHNPARSNSRQTA